MTDRKPPHGIEADGGISDNGAAARTDDMNTIVQMGLAMEELQQQLSDCTLAREQLAAEVERIKRMGARLIEEKAAAEAALAEAVKERDELAAQNALMIEAMDDLSYCLICDADSLTGNEQHKSGCWYANNARARAQALLNVIRAAERWHDDDAPIKTTADEELYAAIRALKNTTC